jgi:hypothetical protein
VSLNPGTQLCADGESLDTEHCHYSELFGSLLYLPIYTVPDISQAVGALARFTVNDVLGYVAGTCDVGVLYRKDARVFSAYCDADHAGDLDMFYYWLRVYHEAKVAVVSLLNLFLHRS